MDDGWMDVRVEPRDTGQSRECRRVRSNLRTCVQPYQFSPAGGAPYRATADCLLDVVRHYRGAESIQLLNALANAAA